MSEFTSTKDYYEILGARQGDSRRELERQYKRMAGCRHAARRPAFVPASAPAAPDIGVLGHSLSALMCLLVGLFLLFLVRFQWIWFLWPLAILAGFVILFGVVMARSAMRAMNESLPQSSRLRRHTRLQEAMFWSLVAGSGYGIYLLLTSV